jgi:tetratricopeptide (TPR) repeat protein
MDRLVSVTVVKPPESGIQGISSIGVVAFESPEQGVGQQLAAEIAKGLNRRPLEARLLEAEATLLPGTDAPGACEKAGEVDALLLGEVTEYSIQASKDVVGMMTIPPLAAGETVEPEWVTFSESPAPGQRYCAYRLKPAGVPKPVEIATTRVAYGLTLNLRLIGVAQGAILWQERIARHVEKRRLAEKAVDALSELERLQSSMVEEVVSRLRPQKATLQRMFRIPRGLMDPETVKLVRQGIEAAVEDDWQGAERLFLRAARLAPEEGCISGNLGVVYEKTGRYLDAIAAYERAYQGEPLDPTYRYYSDDLQTAFVPDLDREDLPTVVLAVCGDGSIYVDGGERLRQHPGDFFVVYRMQVKRYAETTTVWAITETEIACGRIVKVRPGMSLGQITLFDPEREIQRGDMVRFSDRLGPCGAESSSIGGI